MAGNIANDSQSVSRIRNCSWGYKCEKTWESLTVTDNRDIRFCDSCDREVYLCGTAQELADSVLLNRCVAFPSELLHKMDTEGFRRPIRIKDQEDEFEEGDGFMVGEVAAKYGIETRHD